MQGYRKDSGALWAGREKHLEDSEGTRREAIQEDHINISYTFKHPPACLLEYVTPDVILNRLYEELKNLQYTAYCIVLSISIPGMFITHRRALQFMCILIFMLIFTVLRGCFCPKRD